MRSPPTAEPGWSPAPVGPPEPERDLPELDIPERRARARRATVTAAIGVAALIAASVAAVSWPEPGAVPPATTTPGTAPGPGTDPGAGTPNRPGAPAVPMDDELRAVVSELQAYVAQARELPFGRDVHVQLAEGETFEALVDAAFEIDAADVAATAALYEALGLIPPGSADEFVFVVRERYRSILGFYDDETAQLVVRGGSIDAGVRAVIVHELVHALDDQWFELNRPEYQDDPLSERVTSLPMVAEGDAQRIEEQWIEDQPPDVQAEARRHVGGFGTEGLSDHADFLDYGFLATYEAGLAFVSGLASASGERHVDAVILDPPETTEQVLFPDVFERREGRRRVPRPPVDGPIVDEGVVGALFWAGVLGFDGSGVPADLAAAAVEGWGGDWQVSWSRGNLTCTRMDVVGDTDADTAELVRALTQWATERPNVAVGDAGGRARLEVCYEVPPTGPSIL